MKLILDLSFQESFLKCCPFRPSYSCGCNTRGNGRQRWLVESKSNNCSYWHKTVHLYEWFKTDITYLYKIFLVNHTFKDFVRNSSSGQVDCSVTLPVVIALSWMKCFMKFENTRSNKKITFFVQLSAMTSHVNIVLRDTITQCIAHEALLF
jgi:hypothetical protein